WAKLCHYTAVEPFPERGGLREHQRTSPFHGFLGGYGSAFREFSRFFDRLSIDAAVPGEHGSHDPARGRATASTAYGGNARQRFPRNHVLSDSVGRKTTSDLEGQDIWTENRSSSSTK